MTSTATDPLSLIWTRHSVPAPFLVSPAPDGQALAAILKAGASAPDHGQLRPWRFIVIRDEARLRLGDVAAEALRRRRPDAPADLLEKERIKPTRVPLLIMVVVKVEEGHPKIPVVEQILSTGAAVQNMLLAAHIQGYGAKWVTGDIARDDYVKRSLGLLGDDEIAGMIYLGSIEGQPPRAPHADYRPLTIEWTGPAEEGTA